MNSQVSGQCLYTKLVVYKGQLWGGLVLWLVHLSPKRLVLSFNSIRDSHCFLEQESLLSVLFSPVYSIPNTLCVRMIC